MSRRGPKRLRGLRQVALTTGATVGCSDLDGDDDGDHATTLGCAIDEAGLDVVFEATHDMLVEQLGPRRRSGITWRQWQGRHAIAVLDIIDEENPSSDTDQCRAFLSEHPDAFLVMASCAAVRP